MIDPWQKNWQGFLNESEDVTLGSAGNVKQWLLDRWSSLKSSTKESLRLAIEELIESRDAGHLFLKYATGKKLNSEEEAFLKEQAVDILKSIGLVGVIALPGGAVALKFLLVAANKLGVEVLPTSFRKGDEAGMSAGGNNSSYPLPADMTQAQYALGAYSGLLESPRSHADTLAKKMTGEIINFIKDEWDGENEDGISNTYYFKTVDKDVSLDFDLLPSATGTGQPFVVDSAAWDVDAPAPLLDLVLRIDPRYPVVQSLRNIYFKILEDIRHELEHLVTQLGGKQDVSRAEYYIDKGELPSLVRGLHLRAKKMKIPTEEMFRRELEPYVASGEISQPQSEEILQTWKQELDKIQAE